MRHEFKEVRGAFVEMNDKTEEFDRRSVVLRDLIRSST
jgi:hypothetical protein